MHAKKYFNECLLCAMPVLGAGIVALTNNKKKKSPQILYFIEVSFQSGKETISIYISNNHGTYRGIWEREEFEVTPKFHFNIH